MDPSRSCLDIGRSRFFAVRTLLTVYTFTANLTPPLAPTPANLRDTMPHRRQEVIPRKPRRCNPNSFAIPLALDLCSKVQPGPSQVSPR